MEPDWTFVKWPPRTILDIYFDSPELVLYKSGGTFRVRKRQINRGWNVNFKPQTSHTEDFMERREVRTNISVKEALNYKTDTIPGLASTLAHSYVRDYTDPNSLPALRPTLHLVTSRQCYAVRPGPMDEIKWRPGNLLYVQFDQISAIDIREINIAPLIRNGLIDYSNPLHTVTFDIVELEASGRYIGMEAKGLDFMRQVGEHLTASLLISTKKNKYQMSIDKLLHD